MIAAPSARIDQPLGATNRAPLGNARGVSAAALSPWGDTAGPGWPASAEAGMDQLAQSTAAKAKRDRMRTRRDDETSMGFPRQTARSICWRLSDDASELQRVEFASRRCEFDRSLAHPTEADQFEPTAIAAE